MSTDRTDAPSPEGWGGAYSLNQGTWEDFTTRLELLVQDLLTKRGIDVVQLESRTKSVESFVNKLARKDSKYAEPLAEVTDLAGVRVITYYVEDVDRVVACLRDEFDVVTEHSRGSITASDPDRFGYQSTQYVLRLSSMRARLPEWQQFADRCFEIQVRTALQHAWSAIDHKLNYKAEREVPRHLKRRLSRLSALLEIADESFALLRDATEDLDVEYASEIAKGHLDIELDTSSLDAYLEQTGYAEHFTELAVSAGWRPFEEIPDGVEERDKRDLLRAADYADVTTIREVDELLKVAKESWARDALREINAKSTEAGFKRGIPASPYDVLTQLLLFGVRAEPELLKRLEYHEAIQVGLGAAIAAAGPGG